jgi:hypothetical protein
MGAAVIAGRQNSIMSTLDEKISLVREVIEDLHPNDRAKVEWVIAAFERCREQRDTLAAELHAEYERRLGRKFPVDASRADAELLALAERSGEGK